MVEPQTPGQSPASLPGRPQVLVLRPGAIGDTILAIPALRSLRHRFPGVDLHLVGNPDAGQLLLRAGVIDRFTDFDSPSVSHLFVPRMGVERDLFGTPIAAAAAWCSDPEGHLADNLRRLGASWVVVAPSRPPDGVRVHVSEHLLASLDVLGHDDNQDWPLLEALGSLDWCSEGGTGPESPFGKRHVVVHPGSGSPRKNWPPEHFARLVDILHHQLGDTVSIVMVTGPADETTCQLVRRLTKSPLHELRCHSLLQLAGVLVRCVAYVGNDSGISHLAAAVGAPTLAIFGPTDPQIWGPRGRWVWTMRAQPLSSLSPEEVASQALPVIRERLCQDASPRSAPRS